MLDAPLSAAEVIEKDLPHDAPTQSRPPAQRRIDIGDADDTFRHEVINLARQGRLEAVGDMAWDLLVEANRPFPNRRIEFGGAFDRIFRGRRATADREEWDQWRRIEWMTDDAALGMRRAT